MKRLVRARAAAGAAPVFGFGRQRRGPAAGLPVNGVVVAEPRPGARGSRRGGASPATERRLSRCAAGKSGSSSSSSLRKPARGSTSLEGMWEERCSRRSLTPSPASAKLRACLPMTARYRLTNGLTVVLEQQRHAAPVVAFQVWVKVGSADETPDEVGLAHLHEHMLFKGTEAARPGGDRPHHRGPRRGDQRLDELRPDRLPRGDGQPARLDTGSTCSPTRCGARPSTPTSSSREIEVVCEEIKRSLDMPSRRASKALFAEAFRAHPYGRPVIGFEANVRAHTRAARCWPSTRKHYRPSNIVLSAVGDFDEATLRAQVEELFGGDWGRPGDEAIHTRPDRAPTSDGVPGRAPSRRREGGATSTSPSRSPASTHPTPRPLDVLGHAAGPGRRLAPVTRGAAQARAGQGRQRLGVDTQGARAVRARRWWRRRRRCAAAFEETVRVLATLDSRRGRASTSSAPSSR